MLRKISGARINERVEIRVFVVADVWQPSFVDGFASWSEKRFINQGMNPHDR
jgi:hypothetical protein